MEHVRRTDLHIVDRMSSAEARIRLAQALEEQAQATREYAANRITRAILYDCEARTLMAQADLQRVLARIP